MKKIIKVGSDFSGIGAFNQALNRLGIEYKEIFACEMDKFARDTFINNYNKPEYFPLNVYERKIPDQSLDIYMTSPPCQSFSLLGKRLGKNDERGILFFNSYEFIKINKPRYFIFENVKGLISDDNGKTFSEWINLLGGKSINYNSVIFPYENSLPYHIYFKVLNSKDFNVPQNRERIFIVGIRDDQDNKFKFPVKEQLNKKLIDIIETNVNKKYFLSDKMIKYISNTGTKNFYYKPNFLDITDKYSKPITTKQDKRSGTTNYLKVKSANSKGYEIANFGDSINYSNINSKTKRGRVGKQISQTLDTQCNISIYNKNYIRRLTPRECFRLMDFPDNFKWNVSDTQAYKQAGNSIVVNVLYKIIKNLNLND